MTLSFSTAVVDRRSQLSYWREVVCATFVRLGVERLAAERRAVESGAGPAGFRAGLTAQGVGSLQLATIVSEPHAVQTQVCDTVFVGSIQICLGC